MTQAAINFSPALTQNLCLDFADCTNSNENIECEPPSTYQTSNISSHSDTHPEFNEKNIESSNSKRITELAVSANPNKFDDFVLAILAHLSHTTEERWLTWITQTKISSASLKRLNDYDFDRYKIRVVNVKNEAEALSVTLDALNTGTSATVFSDLNASSVDTIFKLNRAAEAGCCEGIILRQSH